MPPTSVTKNRNLKLAACAVAFAAAMGGSHSATASELDAIDKIERYCTVSWRNAGISQQEWEDAVDSLGVSGWLANGSDDPVGFDLDTEFVFTAYDEELAGDHMLFVCVDKATGDVTYVTEFN